MTRPRIGPDGGCYQLTGDPAVGATVTRFAFAGPVQPSPTGGVVVPPPASAGPTAQPTGQTIAPPPATSTPAGVTPTSRMTLDRWLLIGGGALLVLVVATGTVLPLVRRRRRRLAAPAVPEPAEPVEVGAADTVTIPARADRGGDG